MKRTLIIGHKNPDTDSVCSAISYAYLKTKLLNAYFEPRVAGELNEETRFVLEYFNMPAPKLIKSVNTQIKDIKIRIMDGVDKDITIKKALNIMSTDNVATLPVVSDEDDFLGLITIGDIAKSYINIDDSSILSLSKTKYSNIIETINGDLVVGSADDIFDKGKVLIAAAKLEKMKSYISKNDLLIVGDREDAQIEAIKMGVSCLVVCVGADVNDEVLELAKENNTVIIRSEYDTFSVARLISQSMPISHFMQSTSIITFVLDDYLDYVKQIMAKVRYRYFPVLDKKGKYVGMISRRNLLGAKGKQVILVDHNEKGQAVDGIENANVKELIDHHRISSVKTLEPVYFRCQPLGCTCTIIYQMYKERNIDIPNDIAGLMCSAIISDTLLFRSPTCTDVDMYAARDLAKIAGIDIDEYAHKMFATGSKLSAKTDSEIIKQDYKQFIIGTKLISIGQISLLNAEEIKELRDRLLPYMETLLEVGEEKMIFFMLTNILEQSTTLLCVGEDAMDLVLRAYNLEDEYKGKEKQGFVCINGLVSRKKQLVPTLTMSAEL